MRCLWSYSPWRVTMYDGCRNNILKNFSKHSKKLKSQLLWVAIRDFKVLGLEGQDLITSTCSIFCTDIVKWLRFSLGWIRRVLSCSALLGSVSLQSPGFSTFLYLTEISMKYYLDSNPFFSFLRTLLFMGLLLVQRSLQETGSSSNEKTVYILLCSFQCFPFKWHKTMLQKVWQAHNISSI